MVDTFIFITSHIPYRIALLEVGDELEVGEVGSLDSRNSRVKIGDLVLEGGEVRVYGV